MRQHDDGARAGLRQLALMMAMLALLPALSGCPRSEDPAYYVQMLASGSEDTRRRGIEELARMQKKATPALVQALESEDLNTRVCAIQVLARIRQSDSLLAVGRMLDDPEKTVKVEAITAVAKLSQVWKDKSVELLTKGLELSDADCALLAANGLRDMRYDEATKVLRRKFESGEGIQAVYAAKILYVLEQEPAMSELLLQSLATGNPAIKEAAEVNIKLLKDLAVPFLVDTIVNGGTAAGQARRVLNEVRDALITELDETLDSKRADQILHALGLIADQESVDKLLSDFEDHRLETAWRVSAAEGLAVAAGSVRCAPDRRRTITDRLTATMENEKVDNRVRIGAAIALCQLRQSNGVEYLLNVLDRFEEMVSGKKKVSATQAKDLTRLRINAQEALTTSGEFVEDYLIDRISKPRMVEDESGNKVQKEAGPIIIWAAAKTLGDLGVERAVPLLGKYMTAKGRPAAAPTGKADKPAERIILKDDGTLSDAVALKNWKNPDDAEIAEWRGRLEEFRYPDYVRWTVAVALGKIGGTEAVAMLKEAEAAESDYIARLEKNKTQRDFFKREPVIEDLIRQHHDVLFYIRKALKGAGA